MDWLEEKVSCIAKKIRSLSFRSAITAYILVIALAGILLSYMTITICYRYQSIIWNRYNAEDSMWLFSADLENWPFWAISFTGFQRDDRTVMIILDTIRV